MRQRVVQMLQTDNYGADTALNLDTNTLAIVGCNTYTF